MYRAYAFTMNILHSYFYLNFTRMLVVVMLTIKEHIHITNHTQNEPEEETEVIQVLVNTATDN